VKLIPLCLVKYLIINVDNLQLPDIWLRGKCFMVNYQALKSCLEKNGEVMIKTDNGEKIELHKHNVKFDDSTKEIIVDASSETYWIDSDKVSYYWIHREGFEPKE